MLDAIGDTPLVQFDRLALPDSAALYAKWEALNPGGSVKDRPARHLVMEAKRLGLLKPQGVIVEATSGNFGIALAMVGAVLGHRVVVVVDPKVPPAHKQVMQAYGAELVEVTEPDESGGYFRTRMETANRLAVEIDGAFRPDQHFSLMNAAAHYQETGPEILAQMGGRLDYLVVAVSTAGQLRGLSEYLRQHSPSTQVVGVDAVGSGAFGGARHAYLQSGIGLAWPPSNLDLDLIDLMYKVEDQDAFATCRHLARGEGLLAGASSGAVAFVGLHLAQKVAPESRILCVLSDTGQRYLETVYHDGWVAERGLKVSVPLAELRDRAAELTPLPRQRVLESVRSAEPFTSSFAPTTTAVLNRKAAEAMAPVSSPLTAV
ncbi:MULTISPECIES: PLP-dependent cysteine synthase family protein [unclassified Streptomyces]|uniref:PLP-dependent cysteine synthase family protein n=1 Tax=unclassified Streptomyces TaxID=2593676 RepID=UPI0037970B03